MFCKPSPPFVWVLIALSLTSNTRPPAQLVRIQIPSELRIEATRSLDDFERLQFDVAGEVGAHAVRKREFEAVDRIVKTIESTPLKGNEELRIKALVVIARAEAQQGRFAAAHELLLNTIQLVEQLDSTKHMPETLRDFAVAFAEAEHSHRVAVDLQD